MTRPAFPRTSSSGSGFFFCGIRLLPVAAVSASSKKPKLLGCEEDQIFGKTAEMHHRQGGGVQKRGDEIPIACRVDAVGDYPAEAQPRGDPFDVDRRSWCRRSRLIRAAARRPRPAPREAARDRGGRPRRERERNAPPAPVARGACACTTASARRRRPRLAGELADQRGDRLLNSGMRRFKYRRRSTRDLFVARAACVEPAARIADARDQLALDERMDVLVVPCVFGREEPGSDPARADDLLERGADARASAAVSTPAFSSASAHARLPVTSSSKRRRSNLNEAPNSKSAASGSPANRPDQRWAIVSAHWRGAARPLRAAVSVGRPQILMNPSAAV